MCQSEVVFASAWDARRVEPMFSGCCSIGRWARADSMRRMFATRSFAKTSDGGSFRGHMLVCLRGHQSTVITTIGCLIRPIFC